MLVAGTKYRVDGAVGSSGLGGVLFQFPTCKVQSKKVVTKGGKEALGKGGDLPQCQ